MPGKKDVGAKHRQNPFAHVFSENAATASNFKYALVYFEVIYSYFKKRQKTEKRSSGIVRNGKISSSYNTGYEFISYNIKLAFNVIE